MARYFSEQTLLDLSKDMNNVYDLTDLAEFLADVPTSDVVPKRDYDILKSLISHKEEEAYNKGYADAAREIFEEIRKRAYSERGFFVVNSDIDDFIAELKKKYTEGGGLNEL